MADAFPSFPESGSSSDVYQIPTKRILSQAHLAAFQRSQTHTDILRFIDNLNTSIIGIKTTQVGSGTDVGSHLYAFLLKLSAHDRSSQCWTQFWQSQKPLLL
jgi:methylaspartate ammonia-lyase